MKLSTTYRVRDNDTFDSISRVSYGTEVHSSLVSDANPGVLEPLLAGTDIVIPVLVNAPKNLTTKIDAPANKITVVIDDETFTEWQTARLFSAIDSLATVTITAPFDEANTKLVDIFRPYSYKKVQIFSGSDEYFTGTIINQVPQVSDSIQTITVAAYSTPGVLTDCNVPGSSYAAGEGVLEFNDQDILEIAEALCRPFGINVVANVNVGAAFDRESISSTDTIFDFLVGLCKQRNLVLTNTTGGDLLIHQSAESGSPVAKLVQGDPPILSIATNFNGREYYSHVTGIEPIVPGVFGIQHTEKNDRLSGVIRPYTFLVTDAVGGDVQTAVESKIARMFANVASYFVSVATWFDASNKRWAANTTVTLHAPGAMVYQAYEFLIRSVDLQMTENSATAVLELVLPGAFSGQLPEVLPWDA